MLPFFTLSDIPRVCARARSGRILHVLAPGLRVLADGAVLQVRVVVVVRAATLSACSLHVART